MLRHLILMAALLVSSVAVAQTTQLPDTQRAAAGNNPSVSATARIDALRENVNRFISTQDTRITNLQTDNNFLNGRIGALRTIIANFNPVAGCDSRGGPHACACACPSGSKLQWNGTAWTCYQSACPPGQDFDPETCRCRPCDTCTPVGCPEGLQWVPSGNLSDVCGVTGLPGGACVCPYSGLPPAEDAQIDTSRIDPVATFSRQGPFNCLAVQCPTTGGFTGSANALDHSCGCACGFERVDNECRVREGLCPEGQTFVGCNPLGMPTCNSGN